MSINEASATVTASTYARDLFHAPGNVVTAELTILERATVYAVGELLMQGVGGLEEWDGTAAAALAVVAHEIDATAGDVVAGVVVEAVLQAAQVVRPVAITTDQELFDALAGTRLSAVARLT